MIFALLGPSVLAASMAMSPALGPRAGEGFELQHLRREASLPPAAPLVISTTAGSTRSVRTRAERFGPALTSKVRLHAPTMSGAMIQPPPVMIRHPKATPGSSRDPTVLTY